MNQRSRIEWQQILRQYDFVSLPTRGDGTQVAVRIYDDQDSVCCDVLVYREINCTGKALQAEVTRLIETLSHLQTNLPSNPQAFHSTFQSRAINLFGKKVHVLTTQNGNRVRCQMTALLINQLNDFLPSVRDQATTSPAHIIHQSQLEDFLTNQLPKHIPDQTTLSSSIPLLRTSFQTLGVTFFLIPVIIGITGICLSFGVLPFALLTSLLGVLGTVFLLRKARIAFTKFQLNSSIPIHTVKLQTPSQTSVRRVMEVDPATAHCFRDLSSLVFLAQAVVQLPQHQPILEALETVAAQEENFAAQFIDISVFPRASEELQIPVGSVKLQFNGSQRILSHPKVDHLVANIRQLRALEQLPLSTSNASCKTTRLLAKPESAAQGVYKNHFLRKRKNRSSVIKQQG